MDQVLQGLRRSLCLVYLDDIISFGTTFEDALDNLTLIFERLQLKSTKCHLFRTSVPFLGHIVGWRGLECDQEDRGCQVLANSGLPEECPAVPGVRGILPAVYPWFCRSRGAPSGVDR